MEVVTNKRINLADYGKSGSADVRIIHVILRKSEISDEIGILLGRLIDTSWITRMSSEVDKSSFLARAKPTIAKLTNDITVCDDGIITRKVGEYLVSNSAGRVLEIQQNHFLVPLSELWNKKSVGNPGFDFHTEHPDKILVCGEAKYSGRDDPYRDALEQIVNFIHLKKDEMDYSDLKTLLPTEESLNNALNGRRGYAAAFSINASNSETIFNNAISLSYIDGLLNHAKVYLIGIEIGD